MVTLGWDLFSIEMSAIGRKLLVTNWLRKPSVRVALFCWLGCAKFFAAVAQLVERVLGKDEVVGSNPISSFSQ